MCGTNPLCKILDGSCFCSQHVVFQSFPPNPLVLVSALHSQRSLLEDILQSLHYIGQNILTINSLVPSSSGQSTCELSSPGHILASLGKSLSYPYKLSIINSPPNILYKDRNFSLKFAIVDNNNESVTIPNTERFRLGIFTVDYPPTELVGNTAGERILKGNFEAYGCGEVEFRKVCITEVSSHYRNSVFYLAVVAESNSLVKPLVISDLVVKARKISDKPSKQLKL